MQEKKKQKQIDPTAFDDAVMSWIAPEFIRHQRGLLWKIVMPILLFAAIFFGFYYGTWTFSIAIATFAIVYYLLHRQGPKDVEVRLSEVGVKVGGRHYPFSKIKAFWIIYEPLVSKTMYIRVSEDLSLDIPVQLEDQHPALVREFMISKVPEIEGQKVGMGELISRIIKL